MAATSTSTPAKPPAISPERAALAAAIAALAAAIAALVDHDDAIASLGASLDAAREASREAMHAVEAIGNEIAETEQEAQRHIQPNIYGRYPAIPTPLELAHRLADARGTYADRRSECEIYSADLRDAERRRGYKADANRKAACEVLGASEPVADLVKRVGELEVEYFDAIQSLRWLIGHNVVRIRDVDQRWRMLLTEWRGLTAPSVEKWVTLLAKLLRDPDAKITD